MKRKKNNNLILVNVGEEKHYFTSANRVGKFLGIQANSVSWAVMHQNVLVNNRGDNVTVQIVDGSEIPYKLINNN